MCTMLLCVAFYFSIGDVLHGPYVGRHECERVRALVGPIASSCFEAPAVLAEVRP